MDFKLKKKTFKDCAVRYAWPFDIFRNYEKLPLVSRPVAVMHGTEDEVVPVENGRRLSASCQRPFDPFWVRVM